MSPHNYRLYSFVANGYLSPLQCGLQTAHAVGEIAVKYDHGFSHNAFSHNAFKTWAKEDKVIIICAAFNHKGVIECYNEIVRTGAGCLSLPAALFHEDEDSMCGMATACAVVVPQVYYDAKPEKNEDGEVEAWVYTSEDFLTVNRYPMTHPEGQFIDHIKGYRLA